MSIYTCRYYLLSTLVDKLFLFLYLVKGEIKVKQIGESNYYEHDGELFKKVMKQTRNGKEYYVLTTENGRKWCVKQQAEFYLTRKPQTKLETPNVVRKLKHEYPFTEMIRVGMFVYNWAELLRKYPNLKYAPRRKVYDNEIDFIADVFDENVSKHYDKVLEGTITLEEVPQEIKDIVNPPVDISNF